LRDPERAWFYGHRMLWGIDALRVLGPRALRRTRPEIDTTR
jgi:hypothetical protein